MGENRDIERLLRETQVAADREKRTHGARDAPLVFAPGDLVTVTQSRAFPVEWAVLRIGAHSESAQQRRALLVVADAQPILGSGDLEVGAEEGGPIVLRCRFALWTDLAPLAPTTRTGRIGPEAIARAEILADRASRGRLVITDAQAETDQDPIYIDWIDDAVRPAYDCLATPCSVAPQASKSSPMK